MPAADRIPSREQAYWLFTAVLLGIWQSQPEIAAALQEGGLDYTVYLGSLWIKLVKDAYLLTLWAYLVLWIKDPFPGSVRAACGWIYAVSGCAFVLAGVIASPLLALAGVRWILPLFLLLELRRLWGRPRAPGQIALALAVLLAVNLALQIARMFYFPPIWGERWGLVARAPGLFLLPNTNALFVTACAAISIDLVGKRHFLSRVALALALVATLLSQSAGGLIACLVLAAHMVFRRMSFLLPTVGVAASLFLLTSTALLGREGFLEYSGGERIEKLLSSVGELLGPGSFGAYTNAGFMLAAADTSGSLGNTTAVISDSFYVSAIGNFGAFVIPVAALLWLALRQSARHMRRRGQRIGMASLLCLGTFAFSTVVSEAFPMNVMLAAGVWMGSAHSLRQKRRAGSDRMNSEVVARAGVSCG
jgi:hypothetical protein